MTAQPTDYISILREMLPPEWITVADETWFYASHPATPMQVQGWKIHISSRLGTPALTTLRATLEVCLKHAVNFKAARTPAVHEKLNSKQSSREASNKFLTLYPDPADTELLSRLVADLNAVLTAEDAPIVHSDLPLGKQVHTRYGAHRGLSVLQPDSTSQIFISDPREGRLIADPRAAFFSPPAWITTHPITGKSLDDDASDAELYTLNVFEVIDALHFSATGGVYRGKSTATDAPVVLKEGIKNAMYLDDRDAVDRIEAEYKMLEHLAPTGVTPKPLKIFDYEAHKFLAMEYIADAPTLSETAPLAFEAALESASALAVAVKKIHASGVVFGDLSARNVLLPKSGGVKIIDLEGAYFTNAPPSIVFATPGYAPRKRVKGTADDIFSLGAVLTTLFVGRINGLYDLDADPTDVAERFFIAAGLPAPLTALITECLSADAEARPSAAAVAERFSRLQGASTGVLSVDTRSGVDMDIDRTRNRLAACVAASDFRHQESDTEGRRLGIAEGIAGKTLTLQYLTEGEGAESEGAPATLIERLDAGRLLLLEANLEGAKVPPGFANGLAGIAYGLHRVTSARGYAEQIMKRALADPMLLEDPSFPVTLMHGVTGIGLTALYFYQASLDPIFLQGAVFCAERLKDAVASEKAASTAVFYFALADVMRGTSDAELWCARGGECLKALADDKFSKSGMNAPIVEFAVRQSKQFFGDAFCSAFAMEPWEFSNFIPDPSLGGLSGLGIAYLDRYALTGEQQQLGSAVKIAKTVAGFLYRTAENRTAFPAANLQRPATGLFSGAAGALLFLERLRQQERDKSAPAPFFPWEWLCVDRHDLT